MLQGTDNTLHKQAGFFPQSQRPVGLCDCVGLCNTKLQNGQTAVRERGSRRCGENFRSWLGSASEASQSQPSRSATHRGTKKLADISIPPAFFYAANTLIQSPFLWLLTKFLFSFLYFVNSGTCTFCSRTTVLSL